MRQTEGFALRLNRVGCATIFWRKSSQMVGTVHPTVYPRQIRGYAALRIETMSDFAATAITFLTALIVSSSSLAVRVG